MTRVLLSFAAIVLGTQPVRADDSLTLDQAINLALTRNERSQIADLQVEQADAAVSRARTAFLPVLQANGNDTYRPRDDPKNTIQGTLQLSQPIIAPSAFPLLSQAKHLLQAQKLDAVEAKRALAYDVARAYFNVLLAQEVMEAAQKKLDTATADVADTEAQFKAQLVSSNDVTRAKISLSTSVRQLAEDRSSLDAAYIQLGYVIDAPPPKQLVKPAATLDAGKSVQPAPDKLVEQSLAGRPDLRAAKEAALAAHDFAREPRYRILPTLAFVGQLTATSNSGNSGHEVDGSLALTAQWQIFDAGVRYADARSRDAAARISDLDSQALVRSIDADVRTAATQLVAAQAALSAAEDAATSARKSADETAILYHQGLAKAIELVDANEERFEAEVSRAEAEFSVATQYLALRQAMGLGPLEEATK